MPAETRGARTLRPFFHEGWQGIVLVAATYVYFLIFAQFGFLKRLSELGIPEAALPAIMGAMALGGVGMSLLAPRSRLWTCPDCRLQTGLIGCAVAAVCSLFPLNTYSAIGVALVIGLSLGLLTVTLVANLPRWIGFHRPLIKIGLGTGIGYFLCNFPPLFTASPRSIAVCSGMCCVVGLIVSLGSRLTHTAPATAERTGGNDVPLVLALVWFTALVWLDSAAFFIIQNSPVLKAGAWQGDAHLWRTGLLHLAAAFVSAWLLARRGLSITLGLALAALGAACYLLLDPARVPMAAILYPIGVSLYSVALVAYPSFLMTAGSQAVRVRSAGYLYALAGWVGSAMGIGMGQNLHRVPASFVALAAALFLVPWLWDGMASGRMDRSAQIQTLAVVVVLAIAFAIHLVVQPPNRPFANVIGDTAAERGRRVYIAEGCIHCHSQYVRPNSADVAMWGPATDVEAIHRQHPPLIGNRRQGPDLSQVGARRSPLWLRMHFMNPRDVSYDSVMPRFDYLFSDSRGGDLTAYLAGLNDSRHWKDVAGWQPPAAARDQAAHLDGARLFNEHCATCHSPEGAARRKWSSSFKRVPPDLARDVLKHVPAESAPAEIARIAKFGIQGTDMAGHEYLPDDQIEAIAMYVAEQREAHRNLAQK